MFALNSRGVTQAGESAQNPPEAAKRRQSMRSAENVIPQVDGEIPPKAQVGESARRGLIIRRSQVQVLPAPLHREGQRRDSIASTSRGDSGVQSESVRAVTPEPFEGFGASVNLLGAAAGVRSGGPPALRCRGDRCERGYDNAIPRASSAPIPIAASAARTGAPGGTACCARARRGPGWKGWRGRGEPAPPNGQCAPPPQRGGPYGKAPASARREEATGSRA